MFFALFLAVLGFFYFLNLSGRIFLSLLFATGLCFVVGSLYDGITGDSYQQAMAKRKAISLWPAVDGVLDEMAFQQRHP